MAGDESFIYGTLLTLCLLLFAAKVGGEIARKFEIAAVVGELLAGVLLAPTLIGGYYLFGMRLVVVNDPVRMFAELGAIMLLFLLGLETRFADFRRSGLAATLVAVGGVIVPFVLGYYLVIAWGYPNDEALLVGAALTATSTAFTVKVLKDIGRCQTRESGILIGATVIDDVLGLIVMAVVLGLLKGDALDLVGISLTTALSIGIWLVLILFGVFVVARIIDWLCPRKVCYYINGSSDAMRHPESPGHHCMLKCDGAQEASMIAMCFGFAYVAGIAGLAPILGSYAAGMSIAETKILRTIREVTEKINFLIVPMFFVVIGTYVDLTGLNVNSLMFASVLIVLAMISKIIGCSIPILLLNRNIEEAIVVGLGMMCRGEVCLIVAGIGLTSGVFSSDVFSAIILMTVVTTVVTPIALAEAYKRLKFSMPVTAVSGEITDEECARGP